MGRRRTVLIVFLVLLIAIAIAWHYTHVPATKTGDGDQVRATSSDVAQIVDSPVPVSPSGQPVAHRTIVDDGSSFLSPVAVRRIASTPSHTFALTGVVTASGRAVPAARVRLTSPSGSRYIAIADRHGAYAFIAIPVQQKPWTIVVRAAGYGALTELHNVLSGGVYLKSDQVTRRPQVVNNGPIAH